MRESFRIVLLCLLAPATAMAGRQDRGGGPYPAPYYGSGDGLSGDRAQSASERFNRALQGFRDVQSMFALASVPEAAPSLEAAQNLIGRIRQALDAGNSALAMELCKGLENEITKLWVLGNRRSVNSVRYGGGSGDSGRMDEDRRYAAEYRIQGTADRLQYLAQRLESGKNPQAAALLEKARSLLEAARREAQAGRYSNVTMLLAQADPILIELQRLQQASTESDPRGASGPSRDPFKEQQQTAQAQAEAHYQRVYNAAQRLGERPSDGEDPRSAALKTKVFDLLEKAKDALATGQPEAAKGYCLKAESMLTEWHRSLAGGGKLSPAARERVKAKLDLAADIVSASGNGKAARILEKARDHFERAERGRAEGRAALAGVETDLALKLAAKAVDIARSGSR